MNIALETLQKLPIAAWAYNTTGEGKQVAVRTTKVPLFGANGESTLLIGTCVPLNDK